MGTSGPAGSPRRAALLLLLALAWSWGTYACMPPPGDRVYEHAAIVKAVLEGDKTLRLAMKMAPAEPGAPGAASASGPASLEVNCDACSDAKARAIAALLTLAEPDLGVQPSKSEADGGGGGSSGSSSGSSSSGGGGGGGAPLPAAAAAVAGAAKESAASQPITMPGLPAPHVEAFVTRKGARVAGAGLRGLPPEPAAALSLLAEAFAGNPLFVKSYLKPGPVTSCEAPEGAYAFFAPAVLQPACPPALHPETLQGAAPCAQIAADAFDRAFGLRKRLGVTPVTLKAA
ncbi:hypothetical protein Rsub_08466 [Raphidocelis subcapitata]|uniref:Uncharacterized protein n=1 Tax=Raphidocelis subcapitata TaxID=307507 RepID=A0A2V0PFN3_9CHLO|nr:hypothetical protein Rsub_08466 [Raphidocelis subcapitata]|eukprot:GBF95875.1 hypothetical protein Rsub_08466 [Raphidocelis subcapitata]